jgi:hypothetical protein
VPSDVSKVGLIDALSWGRSIATNGVPTLPLTEFMDENSVSQLDETK